MDVLIVFAHPEPASFGAALKNEAVAALAQAGHAAYPVAYRERLASLDATEPLFFHPWDDYDESQRLRPGVAARSGVQWNPARAAPDEDA